MKVRLILFLPIILGMTLNLHTFFVNSAATVMAAKANPGTVPPQGQVDDRRPKTLDDMFVDVARLVPSFGGFFIGPDKALHVYLLNPAHKAAAEAAITAVFGRERLPLGEIRALQGKYSFLQLKSWHDRQRMATLAIPGVALTSIAESKNRLQIGVSDINVISRVERELADLGIPREAVNIVETEPIEFLQTLRDTQRPLKGGLQITLDGGGFCTLSFPAVRQGQAGFVTCSHCTNTQGGTEGTVFHQAVVNHNGIAFDDANRIGVETVDPEYFTGGDCPSGRRCRYSDSAFAARNSGQGQVAVPAAGKFGYIANTEFNDLTIIGDYKIKAEALFPIEGELLRKVGRTTGLTEGLVFDTCVDINQCRSNPITGNCVDTGITMLCQDRVLAKANGGDSGSPVFSLSNTSDGDQATLHGILWGGNDFVFAFSSMALLEAELGFLKTFGNDIGVNSPPEVKILKPQDGATFSYGAFSKVKFEAAVVDYEGCCSEVTWESDKDGFMGQGNSIEFAFNSSGTRVITVKVKDNNGASADDKITVNVSNKPPTATIKKPAEGQTLYKGFTYVFEGAGSDPETFNPLPDSALKWTSGNASDPFPKTGRHPQVSFSTTGSRIITLTATDSDGEKGKDTVTINVINAPPNSPPVVTILYPKNDAALDPYTTVTLIGKADDPDNKSPLTYKWELAESRTKRFVLGTGTINDGQQTTLQWKPSQYPVEGNVLIILYVTDADGKVGSESVRVNIQYPPK